VLVDGSIAIGDPGIRGGRCHVGGIGARGLAAACNERCSKAAMLKPRRGQGRSMRSWFAGIVGWGRWICRL
jgi:hypothetical protein